MFMAGELLEIVWLTFLQKKSCFVRKFFAEELCAQLGDYMIWRMCATISFCLRQLVEGKGEDAGAKNDSGEAIGTFFLADLGLS